MTEEESKVYDRIRNAYIALNRGDLNVKEELEDTLRISKKLNFDLGELQSYAVLSTWYSYNSRYNEAIKIESKALKIAKKTNNRAKEASSYNCLAGLSNRTGNKKLAIEYYMKALNIYDETKNYLMKARVLSNIGQEFFSHKDFKKAESYYLQSWDIFKNVENKSENWNILNNIGDLYLALNEEEKALKYFDLSIKNAQEFQHPVGLSFAYRSLAKRENKKGNYKKALENIELSLNIVEEKGIDIIRMSLILLKAENLFALKKYDLAKEILLNNIGNIKQNERLKDTHRILFSIYNEEEEFELALSHHLMYVALKEKLENLETQKHITSTEAKYQNKIKENEKEILRLQKVEMEQKALRAQLNPHFFFNSLNSINKFIVDNDAENASKFLFQFSSLMRKTLENSEESFITIEEEVDYLKDYLSLEQLRFNFSFQFEIKVDEEIEDDFVKIPTMMLQPYVENCIKHGINGLENGFIKIEFIQEENSIKCIVEDNGKGIGESYSQHKSMGTSILENRLKNLEEQYKLEFSTKSINLEEFGKPSGFKIELSIPIIDN